MLALEAALEAHGTPLPAASKGGSTIDPSGVTLQADAAAGPQAGVGVTAPVERRVYRQGYCPEATLQATLEAIRGTANGSGN
jgi:hypothetical protein